MTLFFELAFSISLPIVIIYWGALFPAVLSEGDISGKTTYYCIDPELALTINVHAGPILGLTFDIVFNSYSFYWRRVILVMVYAVLYLLFNLGNFEY